MNNINPKLRDQAARRARIALGNWLSGWDEIPDYQREDWRNVVDAVAEVLGYPSAKKSTPFQRVLERLRTRHNNLPFWNADGMKQAIQIVEDEQRRASDGAA